MDNTTGHYEIPSEGTAIVFFRPSKPVGSALSSYIVEGSDVKRVKFVCALPNGKKFLYITEPGRHAFASRVQSTFGEYSGFLLEGEIVAGKIYYIEVSTGIMFPVPNPKEKQVERKIKACEWIESLNASENWFVQNKDLFYNSYIQVKNFTKKEISNNPNHEVTTGLLLENYNILPSYGIEELI